MVTDLYLLCVCCRAHPRESREMGGLEKEELSELGFEGFMNLCQVRKTGRKLGIHQRKQSMFPILPTYLAGMRNQEPKGREQRAKAPRWGRS
jgi:hypothetical protein